MCCKQGRQVMLSCGRSGSPVHRIIACVGRDEPPPEYMRMFYNQSSGCFTGHSLVTLGDGVTMKQVDAVAKGDSILTHLGQSARVACVVRTRTLAGKVQMVNMGEDTWFTPYHPVHVQGQWRFPIDWRPAQVVHCEYVYDFVLEGAGSCIVGGVACVTFGHGLLSQTKEEQRVLKHKYFGSSKIVDDLRQCTGWKVGLVTLPPNAFVRDPTTDDNAICGLSKYVLPQRETSAAALSSDVKP
eukprot:m.261898 g.261898  ORF g.261898 m.261898 type:complete len:241 (-) comp15582_c0_seq2:2710-3432(-)